ncbi:MAG: YraN family protein [Patescibacteria group bacterium]|jgi:putative endonuclease|nr:YraN family protein [Patescibacteria group bacterium]
MLAKNTQKTGAFGEKIAKDFLEKKGYKIIDNNINFSNQEVDIIAKLKGNFFIVEVKTSSEKSLVDPEDYIDNRKLQNLKKAAFSFSAKNKVKLENIYFDLIAIKLKNNNKTATIKHYKNIC